MFGTHTHQNKPMRHKVVAGALATMVACSPVLPVAKLVSDSIREISHLQTSGQVDANFLAPVVHVDQGYSRNVSSEIGVAEHFNNPATAAEMFVSNLIDSTRLIHQFVEPPAPVSYWQMNA